jgi:two-component system KDP operon response regulator KdpE
LKRILVVDDERQITRMLRASLQSSGYEVLVAANGAEAYARFEAERPDLIITDLAMPEMTGLDLTRAVRRLAQTPIIVLSVRDTDVMKVTALDEGADDYLTKPFSMPELLARVRAQLRRIVEPDPAEIHLEVGDFVIDVERHTASVRGEAIHLTPKEFDLLLFFARSPYRVLTHRVCACSSRVCARRLNPERAEGISTTNPGSATASSRMVVPTSSRIVQITTS